MGKLLLSGQTGHPRTLGDLKKQREQIAKKWSELGFLKDVSGMSKNNIAMLLESDAIQFIHGYEDIDRWCVYILKCVDGTFYTGMSNNIQKRLRVHRSGKGAKYTRGRLPVILEAYKVVESKSEALKLEYKVKQQSKGKKIEFLSNY